jgi:hypothetical protein
LYPFRLSKAPCEIPIVRIKKKQIVDRRLLELLKKSIEADPSKKNSLI